MPYLEIKDDTFARLKSLAEPLVDTIDSVIVRLIENYEKSKLPLPVQATGPQESVRDFDAFVPPDLTHTKVLLAEFCGERLGVGEGHWNGLLNAAVRKAAGSISKHDDLRRLLPVNFVWGSKTDDGYRFLGDVGVSVQGQDANAAWRAVAHVAARLGCSVNVIFLWRHHPKATFPGTTGQMRLAAQHHISGERGTVPP